jgi:uncharacterized protein YfaS (alpha-2-macroglobulin family)
MRDGLDYLEHFRYECTEQTVSRFLPNVVTYRAYQQLNLDNPELAAKLPGLVGVGLQRLYAQQHVDGGWGWWILDESDPYLTAYVLLGLVEARRADFPVDDYVIEQAISYLDASLVAPKDIEASWQGNRQAFILYVLAEAGSGDLGRNMALFERRQQLDIFGRAYLAMAIHLLDEKAKQIRHHQRSHRQRHRRALGRGTSRLLRYEYRHAEYSHHHRRPVPYPAGQSPPTQRRALADEHPRERRSLGNHPGNGLGHHRPDRFHGRHRRVGGQLCLARHPQ